MRRLLCVAALSLGLAACQTTHLDTNPQGQTWIVPGTTTLSELLEKLGVPQSFRAEGENVVITWRKVKGEGMGGGLGTMGGSIFYWGHMHRNARMLHATAGPDLVVIDVREVTSDGESILTPWPY